MSHRSFSRAINKVSEYTDEYGLSRQVFRFRTDETVRVGQHGEAPARGYRLSV